MVYTPGHAVHHVSYFDQVDGIAFTGDTTGMRPLDRDRVRIPRDAAAGHRPGRVE